jgi:hypothetical protein
MLLALDKEAMTMREFLGEKASDRDRFELELSDTFDVKASIVLAVS